MTARVVVIAVTLAACGPKVTRLSVRADTNAKLTKCLEPGMRVPVRVSAPELGYKPSPTTYVLAASFGRFEGTTLVLPDQPLVFVQRLYVSARYKENDASGSQMIRTRFCHQTVDLRASNAPARVEVGRVPSRRHGPLALIRITQAGRTWWRVTPAKKHSLRLQAAGPVELLVDRSVTESIVELEPEQPSGAKVLALSATLIAAAGGLPDEGEYDPKLDYPDPNAPYVHEDGLGIQSDR